MEETKTLLEQARDLSVKRNKRTNITDEDIELVLAWAKNEITTGAIIKIRKIQNGGNVYSYLALALKEYILRN